MGIIIVVILVVILIAFPAVRCAVFNIHQVIPYIVKDIITYIKHKEYNRCRTGELLAYVGLFGKGKTLSVVHRVVSDYERCNGKMVWCPRRKKMVTQRVKILSNVHLNDVPYERLENLGQVVSSTERNKAYDDENDVLTVTLALGDEFSVQMNSRNFKTNIDPLFLNTILTCRHHYISLLYTAQRFNQVDALLRQVTGSVIDCDKHWRFQMQNTYSAWEMENATNPQMIRPYAKSCWFVRDKDYNAYDTYACVDNLSKDVKAGNMLTEKEILDLQCNTPANMDGIINPNKSYKRAQKKMRK